MNEWTKEEALKKKELHSSSSLSSISTKTFFSLSLSFSEIDMAIATETQPQPHQQNHTVIIHSFLGFFLFSPILFLRFFYKIILSFDLLFLMISYETNFSPSSS